MGQKRKTYTQTEKLKAVQLYLEGDVSYQQVAEQLGIPDTRTVRLWVSRYQEEGLKGLEEKRGKAPKPRNTGRPRKRSLSLEEEVIRLLAENEFLKKWLELEGRKVFYFLVVSYCEGIKKRVYKWFKQQQIPSVKQLEDQDMKAKIAECYQKVSGIYGYRRIKVWLHQKYDVVVNLKRVYRLMGLLGLKSRIRRKRKFFGHREQKVVSSNLLNREFQASQPNQKWVTDVTYLLFNGRRLYLSVLYDLYNNEVVSYKLSKRNDLRLVIHTVKAAIKKRDVNGVLLHSDQGYQYTSRQP